MRGHRVADAPVTAADQVLGLELADRMGRRRLSHAGRWQDEVGPGPVEGPRGVVVDPLFV
jgi:hypothetical protein